MHDDASATQGERTPLVRAWLTRALALALLATASLAPVLPAPFALAHATPGLPSQVPGGAQVADVTLTEVEPAVVGLDDVLTLSGVITNTGDAPLTDPLPAVRWSSDPLQTLDDVDLVATNPLFRYGLVDYRFSEVLPTLEPGEQTAFSVEVDLEQLPLRSGVHVFGIDVLATLPDGLRVFVAAARTTVPVEIDVDAVIPVALLWPLAAAPTLLPDGRLVDDSLAGELAAGGRLNSLVRLGAGTPVTWVVDPDLVRTAAAMADGYETVGSEQEGAGAADAQQFLADLAAAIPPRSDVRSVPAADPDVGGALAAGIRSDVLEAGVADGIDEPVLATLVGRSVPALSLLVDRPVTDRMLGTYLRGGVTATVLARAATTAGTTTAVPDAPPARARLERTQGRDVDAVLAGVPPADAETVEATGSITARQWFLSSTALLAAADPPATDWVVAPPLRWQLDATTADTLLKAWQETDWVSPVPLSDVEPADQAVSLVDGPDPDPIPDTSRDALANLAADVERLQPLFVEPPLPPDELPRATARAISFAWQDEADRGPAQGQEYLDALVGMVTAGEDELRLVVSPSITLSSRSGRFPVSVVNDSSVDVVVGVRFTSQNTSRLRVEDVEPVVLTSGEKLTITATALATANGRVQVQAELVTTEGDQVGAPVTTLVDVTNVGALGWVVIGAGGALLGAALIRLRLRRRANEDPT
jgi:hypothetical protein